MGKQKKATTGETKQTRAKKAKPEVAPQQTASVPVEAPPAETKETTPRKPKKAKRG